MKLVGCLLFFVFILLVPRVFAQESDQSSAGSGVLVSSPTQEQVSDQNSSIGNHGDSDSDIPSQDTTGNSSNSGEASNSSDEIVAKSTNAVMLQIKENMKLTQDQVSAIEPIIEDDIVKVRNLQLSLENGTIDGKTMYSQRQQLANDEDQKLSQIFTPDQMKVWMNIQNP